MKSRSVRIAQVCGIILAAGLLLGEFYARFISPAGDQSPAALKAAHERTNLRHAPSLFARNVLAPSSHLVYFSENDRFRFDLEQGFESRVKWTINSLGYRGPEISWAKSPGTVRIIVYGGSFVFDIRTEGEMDWPRQAERILRERGHRVEIVNAGIPGHMSFDSLGRFFTEGHRLDPDIAVLCNKWNDLKYFSSSEPLGRQIQPGVQRPDPRFEYQGLLDRWLCSFSQLYCRGRGLYWPAAPRYETTLKNTPPPPESTYTSSVTEEALQQYKLHFELFADTARHRGVKPVLMTQPLLIARDNSPEARAIIEYEKVKMSHERLLEAMNRADEIVRSVAQESGAELIDASVCHVAGRVEFFTDHVHLTREGSREFARVFANALEGFLP